MGTYSNLEQLVRQFIGQNGQNNDQQQVERQAIAEMDSPQMRVHASEREIYRFIEAHPLHPLNQHRLTRFTDEEREERRVLSETMRGIMASYMVRYHNNFTKLNLGRFYGALLNYHDAGDRGSYNENIIRLFKQRSKEEEEAYIKELVDERVERTHEDKDKVYSDVSDEIRNQWPSLRGSIIYGRINFCVSYMQESLEKLTKLDVSSRQLDDNFCRVMEIYSAIYEIDNFISAAGKNNGGAKPYIELTDEQIQRLKEIKDTFQPIVATLRDSLCCIANPCYEFIEPSELAYFDIRTIEEEYRTAISQVRNIGVDNFTQYMKDRVAIQFARDMQITDDFEKMCRKYGLEDGATFTVENADDMDFVHQRDICLDELKNGHPVVVSKGDTVIVISRGDDPDLGDLSIQTPEELFNHYFGSKKIDITKRLIDVDPVFLRSSPEFRAMRKTLEKIVVLPDLPAFDIEKSEEYEAMFTTLKEQAQAYLAKKNKKTEHSSLETRRMEFVKEVEAFANLKLEHLNILNKAHETLITYNAQEIGAIPIIEEIPENEAPIIGGEQDNGNGMREEDEPAKEDENKIPEAKAPNKQEIKQEIKADNDAPKVEEKVEDIKEQKDEPEVKIDNNNEEKIEDIKEQEIEPKLEVPKVGKIIANLKNEPAQKEDNKVPAAAGKPDRDAAPLDWMKTKKDEYAAALPALKEDFDSTYKEIWLGCENVIGDFCPYNVSFDMISKMAGAMIAAEFVCEEKKALADKGVQGVYETLLCGEKGSDIRLALGQDAILSIYGKEIGESDDESIDFFKNFDPAKTAADIKSTFDKKYGIDFMGKLEADFCNTIKPMHGAELDNGEKVFADWTYKNILEPGYKYCVNSAIGENKVDIAAAKEILASCVLHNIIQLKRISSQNVPADIETMLSDPAKSAEMRNNVMGYKAFDDLVKDAGLNAPEVKADALQQAIEKHLPHKAADTIFKSAFAQKEVQPQQKVDAPQVGKHVDKPMQAQGN